MTAGKHYLSVSVHMFRKDLSKYLNLAEQGYTIYVIKRSIIVAELRAAQFKDGVK